MTKKPYANAVQKNKKPMSSIGDFSKKPSCDVCPFLLEYKDKYFRWTFSPNKLEQGNTYGNWKVYQDTPLKDILFIFQKLASYESWTWRKIESSSNHTSTGLFSIDTLDKQYKDIVAAFFERNQLDTDSFYKIEINGKHRIWGIREDNVFFPIWNDTEHLFYRVPKKHT